MKKMRFGLLFLCMVMIVCSFSGRLLLCICQFQSHNSKRDNRDRTKEIRESLCDLDCGSCGAPTCQALAEDIVKGEASPDDCIIRLRQKYRQTQEITDDEKKEE